MDALSTASPYERVVLIKGAQTGGSEAGLNWLGYIIQNAPGIAMLLMPSLDMVRRNTTVRIDPLIEATPALRELVAAPRSRDAGNSLFRKSFPGGQLVMTGANSAVGLRSTPVRYLFLDEVDGYPGDADGEGDPVDLAIQRTTTFWGRRKIYMVSTPTLKGHSRIEAAFEHSDRRFFHVPCLHCGDMAPITWARIRWPEGRRDEAYLVCEACHGGADPDTARRAAFEALAKRSAPSIRTEQVRVEMGESQDDPALRARQMGEALYARINPRHDISEPARRYAYSTPVDMAKELLTLRGESTMALSPASLVTRALHTTSDFPIILGDTVGRVLRDAYQAAPSGIRRLGRQTTTRDFRAVNKIMLGEAPLLEKLNEHGEIKAGTMAEAREAYKVETWARKIGITRQVLVNDDLGAFADLARRMGQAAAETEARILVTLLEAGSGNGPTMSDGKTLFHADHGNKAGTGSVISDATLSAARLALRTQKGIKDRTIRVTPRNLLVPPALETTAEKWLASIAPATAADVNPFSGSLSLVVEPRLSSATRWYVTADPGEIDGLEFAYLSGAEGPQVESRSGWDVDGVEIRVILDFGAGFIDHRGWFMNAGA
ncbi:hypothetical protein FGG78_23230 [Thioclava sp. BHET1]|nr:hypothetical protein FGG78_23230 [Thioclava sp. BHET1]